MSPNSALQEYRKAILDGMARSAWVFAWMDYATEIDMDLSGRDGRPPKDWYDAAPSTPRAAAKLAEDMARLIEEGNMLSVEELFDQIWRSPVPAPRQEIARVLVRARSLGDDLAAAALGARDLPESVQIAIPQFTATYDGEFLTWEGSSEGTSPIHNPAGVDRILLIEDEPARQADMQRLFKRLYPTASVTVVDRAVDANHIIGSESFDLIVSDWDLADGTTGGDVLDYIHDRHPELANRFLFASGNAVVQDVHPYWIMKGEITKSAFADVVARMPQRNPACRCAEHS